MELRICSKCGAEWYSADTITVWICQICGNKMPKEMKVQHGC